MLEWGPIVRTPEEILAAEQEVAAEKQARVGAPPAVNYISADSAPGELASNDSGSEIPSAESPNGIRRWNFESALTECEAPPRSTENRFLADFPPANPLIPPDTLEISSAAGRDPFRHPEVESTPIFKETPPTAEP